MMTRIKKKSNETNYNKQTRCFTSIIIHSVFENYVTKRIENSNGKQEQDYILKLSIIFCLQL